jgi:hypothetical protein
MTEALEKGEKAYALDHLLNLMRNNSFATTVITTSATKFSTQF